MTPKMRRHRAAFPASLAAGQGRVWAILGVFLLLYGCAGTGRHPPGAAAVTVKPFVMNARDRVRYHVLAGELAVQKGLTKEAAKQYVQAAKTSGDPDVAERATRLALAVGDDQGAQMAARRWATLAPRNLQAHQAEARLSVQAGDMQGALDGARAVIKLDPDGPGAAFRKLAVLLAGIDGHADLALGVMHKLVAEHARLAEAHYAEGVLAQDYQRATEALASANRAITLEADLTEAYLLKANSLLNQGKTAQANRVMQRVFARNPGDTGLKLNYGRMLAAANHPKAARAQFQAVLRQEPDNGDAHYALALLALDQGDTASARRGFMRLYNAGKHRDSSAYYLGRIQEQNRRYSKALTWYKRVQTGPHALDAALRQAEMMARLGQLNDALRFLRTLRSANPQVAQQFYVGEAQLLFNAARYQDAVKTYDQALQDYPDDPNLLYGRAITEVKLGHAERAEADLKRVIRSHPQDARALNALGYILSNHSTRYREALGYIRKALKLTPNDPAVIDSMGWVQYRLGQLQLARTYLERAFHASSPPDAEIAAHLGEVLWKLGRHEQARKIWQQGLSQSPENPAIQATMKRLTQ